MNEIDQLVLDFVNTTQYQDEEGNEFRDTAVMVDEEDDEPDHDVIPVDNSEQTLPWLPPVESENE